jgi:hypothetical protein
MEGLMENCTLRQVLLQDSSVGVYVNIGRRRLQLRLRHGNGIRRISEGRAHCSPLPYTGKRRFIRFLRVPEPGVVKC